MPMQFELSCIGGRPLIKLFYYEQLTTAVKRCFLSLQFTTVFSSFDVKRFCRPLYLCVSLRLVENKREKSLNEAKNLAIATTYELGALSFKI